MNTPQLIRWLSALALTAALNLTASAQVLSYTGGTLTENFDSMGRLGANTPPGWFVGFGTSANTTAVTPGMGLQAPNAAILGWNLGSTNGTGATCVVRGQTPSPVGRLEEELRMRNRP